MSHAVSDIGNAVSNTFSSIGHALTNPAALIGTGLGFGIGGAGGLTGGNLAGNVATGQPITSNLGGAAMGDLAGLGFGAGAAGMMGGAPGWVSGADLPAGSFNAADPFANMGVDIYGNPISAGAASPFGGYSAADMGIGDTIGGGGAAAGAGGLGGYGGLAGAGANIASRFLGGGGQPGAAGGGGNPFMNFLTGQGGGPSLPSLAPGLAALQYARNQQPINTEQLQSVFNQAGANAPLFVQAAQDPLKQAQAGGYGDILNSQAQRGIRGSSFGDQSIANYLTDTNRGIADAGASAAQQALGLQGSLAGQISNLNALSQQMKNNLYGRAFSSIGQGLNPTPGMEFGAGAGGAPGGVGGMPGLPGGTGGFLNNLNLGGVGNAFGNLLGGAGSGLGNLFGSPGSTFWSGPAMPPLANAGLDSIYNSGGYDVGF